MKIKRGLTEAIIALAIGTFGFGVPANGDDHAEGNSVSKAEISRATDNEDNNGGEQGQTPEDKGEKEKKPEFEYRVISAQNGKDGGTLVIQLPKFDKVQNLEGKIIYGRHLITKNKWDNLKDELEKGGTDAILAGNQLGFKVSGVEENKDAETVTLTGSIRNRAEGSYSPIKLVFRQNRLISAYYQNTNLDTKAPVLQFRSQNKVPDGIERIFK